MRLELKTYQDVKQLWTKWAKFKRYVKVFFILFSLLFRACFLFLQITKKTKKQKNKKTFSTQWGGVRSWLAYPESLRFQVFSLFLICRDRTRCTAKSIRSREDKKKTFPYCFWFAAIAQGAWQRAYAAREGNSPRLKQKIYW